MLLKIIIYYNPSLTNKLSPPNIETLNNKLVLKPHSLKQLNIINTQSNSGPYSSVEKLINKCKTSMGKREFNNILVSPSTDIKSIKTPVPSIEEQKEIEIVTLGPLTNIAGLVQNNSDKLGKIKHCYIMGGSSNALGNITKFAEYNFWVDPEAADIVLNSGIPITVIGWDPSLYDAMIDTEKIQEIESIGTKYSKFTNDIQVVLREMMKDIFGSDSYDLPDPLAMSVYLDNVRNVDSTNTTSNYLANSAFIIDGEDYNTTTGKHIGYQGSTDQPGHVRMFRGATILKPDTDGSLPDYNKEFANTDHTLDVYGGVYLFDSVGTDYTHLTISGENPRFFMNDSEGSVASIDGSGNMFLKGDIDICGGLNVKDKFLDILLSS